VISIAVAPTAGVTTDLQAVTTSSTHTIAATSYATLHLDGTWVCRVCEAWTYYI